MNRTTTSLPLHFRAGFLVLAFLGGTLGTALRAGLSLAFPGSGHSMTAILAINVTGALVLGFLLETLARRGPDHGIRRAVRIFVGTGLLGGFTTYSTLAVNTVELFSGPHGVLGGILYGIATAALGLLAAAGGVVLAQTFVRAEPDTSTAAEQTIDADSSLDDEEGDPAPDSEPQHAEGGNR